MSTHSCPDCGGRKKLRSARCWDCAQARKKEFGCVYPAQRKSHPCGEEKKRKLSMAGKQHAQQNPARYGLAFRAKQRAAFFKARAEGKMPGNPGAFKIGCKHTEEWKRKNSERQQGEKHWNWKGGEQERACDQCGKPFSARSGEHKRFCTHTCYAAWVKESGTMAGSNNPRWSGGPFPYPEAWKDSLREAIRERDGCRCQLCHKPQAENNRWRLSVHHIDEDKDNLDPKNLVALCTSCHTSLHNSLLRVVRSCRKGKVSYALAATIRQTA